MVLNTAQFVLLKNDIVADIALNSQPQNSDGAFAIASAYNLNAVSDYWVWRSSVSKSELVSETSVDNTTFTWVGNGFITRSAGEQTAFREIFGDVGMVNAALPQVRQAFLDIFSGTGNAAANRTHLATISRRRATRAEKLFAVGTGTTAAPALMTFEGALSYQDMQTARELP